MGYAVFVDNKTPFDLHFIAEAYASLPLPDTVGPHESGHILGTNGPPPPQNVIFRGTLCTTVVIVAYDEGNTEVTRHPPGLCMGDTWVIDDHDAGSAQSAAGTSTEAATPTPSPASPRIGRSPVIPTALPSPTDGTQPTFGPAVILSGDFRLSLITDAADYAAGQPISAQAELEYLGNKMRIKIASLGPGPLGWGVAKLDGTMYVHPDWTLECQELDMSRGAPLTDSFTKMDGLQGDGVTFDQSLQWLNDPDLRLTEGRWVIYVEAMAGPDGVDCQAWTLQASAQVVVR